MSQKINNLLIPNVSSIPSQHSKVGTDNKLKDGQKSDFQSLLNEQVKEVNDHGVKLSTHAAKRLSERNLSIDSSEFMKLKDAMDKIKNKGGKDSLVVTSRGAYIVDAKNNTIVTAIDKGKMNENVFTKIDSTIFVD